MAKLTYFIAALLMAISVPTTAEVISITDPRYQVPNDESGVVRPTRGMSMNAVINQYGEPKQKHNAVGEPPITRWVYPEFVVFFEHSTVIHAVVPK